MTGSGVPSPEPPFFEGDLVLCDSRAMCVLACTPAGDRVTCVWYEDAVRLTAEFGVAQLQMVSHSPLRPGYRLVQARAPARSWRI